MGTRWQLPQRQVDTSAERGVSTSAGSMTVNPAGELQIRAKGGPAGTHGKIVEIMYIIFYSTVRVG